MRGQNENKENSKRSIKNKYKEKKMNDFALWSEVITVIVSIGVSYGVIKAKVAEIERKVEKFDKDHDLLVEIRTKLDLLLSEPKTKGVKK